MFSLGRETGERLTKVGAAVLPVLQGQSEQRCCARRSLWDVLERIGTNREIPVDTAEARQ